MLDEIPLSRPDITLKEIQLVQEVLRTGRLSMGPMQERFEDGIARRVGRSHAVACSSGTAGLHMVLHALGIGPGDEVVTTPFSFVASSNAILYVGANPVFVDIDPSSLNMDPEQVRAAITPRTKAILAVEAFGNPRHMETYRSIADQHEIRLIEDSCEGLGGAHRGRPIGGFGHASVFGFYPNKQITTGEGGMVLTDDDRLANACRMLRNHGRPAPEGAGSDRGTWLTHEVLGFNYRMSELQAAMGVAQLQRLDNILECRERVARRYMERFIDHPDIILPTVDPETRMSWFVFVLRLGHEFTGEERDRIIEGMHRHDVGAAAYFPCIHLLPFYRQRFGFRPGTFPIAESVAQRTIALPFFTRLGERDADFAAQTLELMLSRESLKRS